METPTQTGFGTWQQCALEFSYVGLLVTIDVGFRRNRQMYNGSVFSLTPEIKFKVLETMQLLSVTLILIGICMYCISFQYNFVLHIPYER